MCFVSKTAATRARVALLGGMLTALLLPACALAQGATGGTAAPAAAIDSSRAGGVHAPVGQGTGGSEYGFLAPASRKALPHRHPAALKRPVKPAPKRHARPKSTHKPAPKSAPPAPAPPPAPKPAAPPAAEAPAGVPTPTQTLADGAVFPVRGGSHSYGGPEDRFGAPRSNHTHQGQDILAAEKLDDVAPLAGTIIATGNQPGAAGWWVAEHTSIGFDLFFAHCEAESILVKEGQAVSPGTVLCKLGSTGDATGPHLHFEMWVGGWQAKDGHPIDPLPYLEAWEGR